MLVLTRVISKPSARILCLDLGHKAIASESPHPISGQLRLDRRRDTCVSNILPGGFAGHGLATRRQDADDHGDHETLQDMPHMCLLIKASSLP